MAGKETKHEEGAISEFLAADDWESDAKASDVEGYFEEEEEEEEQQQQQHLQASAEVKPQAAKVADYQHGNHLKENKYSSFCQSSKRWTTKLFFHILDLTVLNSWILLSSCGAKYTHRDFRLLLVRKLIEEAEDSQDRPNPRLVVRPSVGAKNVLLLESCHNKHWPVKSSTQMCCYLCAYLSQRKGTVYKCTRCDVGLFNLPCFVEYHTKVNF